MPTHHTIEEMQQHASQQGGKCLSKEYWDDISRLMWMCSKGHVWESPWRFVSQGLWCPQCLNVEKMEERRKEKKEKYFELLKAIAKERGGKLLTEKYIDSKTNLLWECAKGHQWYAKGARVKSSKHWCPYCVGRYKTIKEMQEVAAKRGGKCLSEKYIKGAAKLLWECKDGHQWEATPGDVMNSNSWCPVCSIKKTADSHRDNIETYRKLAVEKGGRLLSEKYINSNTPLFWECKEGHHWSTKPISVKSKNTWCPVCAIKKIKDLHKYSIEIYQKLALERGGKLLSENYINSKTKMLWQCAKGHQWNATGSIVKSHSWCPYCKGLYKTIKDMQELATLRGGKCLSEKYISWNTKLEWQCNEGHIWKARPTNVIRGSWCPVCGYKKVSIKKKDNIETYKKIANEHGGKLITDTYINCNTKMLWECSKGHQWYAKPSSIKNNKHWCPYCAGFYKTINDMKELAAKKGGKCLSDEYITANYKLEWECSKGHKWKAVPSSIANGIWCPACGIITCSQKKRHGIELYRKIAEERGGKLLSDEYINCDTKMLWQCSEGHQWYAIPYKVKKNHNFCPVCTIKKYADSRRDSIETYQKLAIDHSGKLLSEKYIDSKTKLLWQCSKGHQWEARPSDVKDKKSWCPHCYNNKRKKK